jgi:hypothetical protein
MNQVHEITPSIKTKYQNCPNMATMPLFSLDQADHKPIFKEDLFSSSSATTDFLGQLLAQTEVCTCFFTFK